MPQQPFLPRSCAARSFHVSSHICVLPILYPPLNSPGGGRRIVGDRDGKVAEMLQLLFAVAFSAVPLTLYVPPIRSLNPFVEAVETLFREVAAYSMRAYPRIRFGVGRIMAVAARERR